MRGRSELLELINKDIPKGVDWKLGAERYVANCFEKTSRGAVEQYSLTKPLAVVGDDDPGPAILEAVNCLNNFTNALALLKPVRGARILDVACGGGWVSHFLSRMGYWTFGIDISKDFIDLAAKRLAIDPMLGLSADEAAGRFTVLDIERQGLPSELQGTFDYIWLESCLHHFVDPISALEHMRDALKPDGLIILMEFENRTGPIKPEYMEVMRDFDTLERPYSRSELLAVLDMVGLKDVEFFGTMNGWFSPKDRAVAFLSEAVRDTADQINLAICGKQPDRLDALCPYRKSRGPWSFLRGVHPNEGSFRWCEPFAELQATKAVAGAEFRIHTVMPGRTGRNQVVTAYSSAGEIARVEFSPAHASDTLRFDQVAEGERITLASAEAFRPSWDGSDDPRLLSFYLETAF